MKQLLSLFFIITQSVWVFSQSNCICIGSEDVYVRGIICISSGFEDQSGGNLDIQGELCFINSEEVEIQLSPDTDYLNTTFNMRGSANSTFISSGAKIAYLEVNTDDADLILEDDLEVVEQLSLFNGRILTGDSYGLQLLNSSESSLVFNSSADNTSYIAGSLQRTVLSGSTYSFPLGDANGFHPMLLSELSDDGTIKVSYDAEADANWFDRYPDSELNFACGGGWLVDSENTISYKAHLSLIDNSGSRLSNKYAVFHCTDYPFYQASPDIDREAIPGDDFYLQGSKNYSDGLFAVVESNLGYLARSEELELVNTIVIGSSAGDKTRFIVPGMSDFQNIRLKVYNSLGGLIFTSDNYTNELDFRRFRDGTYYYYLSAILKDGNVINKSDMIEIIRSNE